jgi:hypothetical protein
VTPVTCNDGKSYVGVSNTKANVNSVVHVVGTGHFKLVTLTAFFAGTTDVAFTDRGNYPKTPNITCNATFTDPQSGQAFDVVVTGYLRRKK